MMEKIKILIVDDSAFMRKSLEIMLKEEPTFEIVGKARNGLEAVELNKKLSPDIITMDIEMPVLNGLKALEEIMKEKPTAVLMVSSLTTDGAEATLKALELGAVDFIPKGMSYVNMNITKVKEDLKTKIKAIVRRQRLKRLAHRSGRSAVKSRIYVKEPAHKNFRAVAIGISTGGPLSLQKVIPLLRSDLSVPVFIVQHMPPKFTLSLAQRLNSLSKITVKEAEDGEVVQNGVVYIAPGGKHMTLQKNSPLKIRLSNYPSDTLHKPSVDVMVSSLVDTFGKDLFCTIMTGMGHDGLEGVKKLKKIGGYCVAQDEASSVIYGMPKAIVDNNLADAILPLDKIPEYINKVVR